MPSSFADIESWLLAWPDQLPAELASHDPAARAALALRRQRFGESEALLLGALARAPQDAALLWLLIFLRLVQEQREPAAALLARVQQLPAPTDWPFWYLQVQLRLSRPDNDALEALVSLVDAAPRHSVWRQLCEIALALRLGQVQQAGDALQRFQRPDCLEWQRLQARWLLASGQGQQALSLLSSALQRFPQHRGLARQLTILTLEIKAGGDVIPALRHALQHHGERPEFLPQITQVKLLQRQPALARRTALLDRTWASLDGRRTNVANHLTSYEMCGNVGWFPAMLPALRDPQAADADFDLLANLCCQYASLESPIAAQLAPSFCQRLLTTEVIGAQARVPLPTPPEPPPLRVAWISGDLCPHPVSRFLLSFLEHAATARAVEHLVVSLEDHQGQSIAHRFADLERVELLDLAAVHRPDRWAMVRERQPHVAFDLSGWTGGNFQPGFLARLAPVQINYLGYFASTGNPATDIWLGDEHLFPEPMHEWHSEALHRLGRCFIAWQPSQHFPEATAAIADAPDGGIRFGSFNHNRKLSDQTLALWGQILQAIPGASLVLKAHHEGDPGTRILLQRRMRRHGLDPDRVIWLPIAPSSAEHLQQYAQVDVALDCFPNGGCTTTCEALWMGVPVITLSGHSYVSRMSTAVLHGANLPDWCAPTPQAYLDMAVAQADRLRWLRQHRDHWRQQLQTSSLGDAADLMRHLGDACRHLYAHRPLAH